MARVWLAASKFAIRARRISRCAAGREAFHARLLRMASPWSKPPSRTVPPTANHRERGVRLTPGEG